ncbi:MAG: sugar transferase [Rickettsiales bacterium]|nr:sugar transferase [Rickettsiales bacterium]
MKKYLYFFFDIACITIALLIALYLRNGTSFIEAPHPYDLLKVLAATISVSALILMSFNTYTSMWRFTSQKDLRNIILSITLVVLLSNSLLFLLDRLEVIPRSVPPIHWAFCVFSMCGSRLLVRRIWGPIQTKTNQKRQSVLIVGVNHVTELYLSFAERILHGGVIIEGIIDEDTQLHGRAFHKHSIIGNVNHIPELLERFLVHGIRIDQVILAQPFDDLNKVAKETLTKLQNDGTLKLVHFSQDIIPETAINLDATKSITVAPVYEEQVSGSYPYLKRLIDIAGSLTLAIILSPLLLLTFLLVIIDIGLPAFFWQQRPGHHGRNFRLYKFRTMLPASRRLDQERLEHKANDNKRSSIIGKMIRHLRLDELPQLFHILTGTMSFIGPRPLLPEDQPENGEVRLSVRPGVSGWAQVHGGDYLTPAQKLILDYWYIQNMSLWLDIRITIKTLTVMFIGSKPALDVVEQCRTTQFSKQSFTK